MLYMYITFII